MDFYEKTMSDSKLFQPLHIGGLHVKSRVVMAPLTRLRASAEHVILPMAKEYYAQRASTPATLLIAESNLISPAHGGAPHMPGIWNKQQVAAWKEVVDAVHVKGCYIYCQLVALGRVADEQSVKSEGDFRVVSSSAVPFENGATPHALTKSEIQLTVNDFADAARNAISAGFDGVEIHGANGYLVDQFTQDNVNVRTDEYGGSIENRARFALEVASAVGKAVGKDKLGFRISPFSTFQGMKMSGNKPTEQFDYLVNEMKKLDLAYLHVIESRVINNIDTAKVEGIEGFLEIWGKHKPVLVAGGFLTAEKAREAIDEEYKEHQVAVVFGRRFISTPDLVFRTKKGLELNAYDRSTFYAPMQEEGYLDYEFSPEFQKQNGVDEVGRALRFEKYNGKTQHDTDGIAL